MADDLLGGETRRLLDAATRGPWEWDDERHRCLTGQAGTPGMYEYRTEVLDVEHDGGCGCRRMCEMDVAISAADAELIAAAPRLLAGLLAERDAAVARVAELEAAIGAHQARKLAPRWVVGGAHDHILWAHLPAAPSTPAPTEETNDA